MRKIFGIFTVLALVVCSLALTGCEHKSTDDAYFNYVYDEASASYTVSAASAEMPKAVIIPATHGGHPVKTIGDFSAASDITEVLVQGSTVTVSANAFSGLKNLKRIEFPSAKFLTVGDRAFKGCSALKEFTVNPVANVSVGVYALSATSVRSFEFGGQVTVADNAFADSILLEKLSLGSLQSVGADFVRGCTALKEFTANGVYASEDGNLVSEGTFVKYAPAKKAASFTCDYQGIGPAAFSGAALDELVIGPSVVSVDAQTFAGSSFTRLVVRSANVTLTEDMLRGTSVVDIVYEI